MQRTIYREIKLTPQIIQLAVLLVVFILAAGGAELYIEEYGHIVTGMTNQIVWGLPHVFAIFLIVAASGALNVASIASVFGKSPYKPLARLSGLLALALLAGGLAVLVLDLGRPDRLIVAMTKYNFVSIFAWNIYLYTGFFAVVGIYLYVQMERGISPSVVKVVGTAAFLWRLALTTGTGSIFGWLVARDAYNSAIMAPLFIVMSFAFGLAVFILVVKSICGLTGRAFGARLLHRLGRLLGIFVAGVLFFVAVQHLTNLYSAQRIGVERFILLSGGIYTQLFWFGQVLIGGIIPLVLVYHPTGGAKPASILTASALVIIGGFAQLYVLIVGGQAYPLDIFPGFAASSSFFDGQINTYTPSLPEILLGLGGVALALALTGFGMKILRILPTTLSDVNVDPLNNSGKGA
ncbi:MAG: polysulfide reductase NrfD [Alphaproteobacteria bacterium]|nr:polysulfide reductase NrfD [Alphaproteobacteria bacterium]